MVLKGDRLLFSTMILIAQNRKMNMHDVFSHPLGHLPLALANADGSMKKTNKASLANYLETLIDSSDSIVSPSATLIDGMALIQKLHGENHTFRELSEFIFDSTLSSGHGSTRIDIVFDVYREKSIKTAERVNRGSSEGVLFNSIRMEHRIKN